MPAPHWKKRPAPVASAHGSDSYTDRNPDFKHRCNKTYIEAIAWHMKKEWKAVVEFHLDGVNAVSAG